MNSILTLLRPGDWIKNVFVLAPLVFWLPGAGRDAGADLTWNKSVASGIAFVAFCLAASGWYCINDVLDAEEDRLHPIKRRRPVASGAVRGSVALWLGVALIVAGVFVANLANPATMWIVLAYAVLQGTYNLGFKRIVFIDVTSIACGFCLRAVGGAMAIAVPVSIWLMLCVFFLTLYLGFIKRTCDLASAGRDPGGQWKQRANYGDITELNWLLAVSGTLTVLMYLMYTLSQHAQGIFGGRALGLALLSPIVLVVVHRFYRRAVQGLSDSPLDAMKSDPIVAIAFALFGAGVFVILYVPGVEDALRRALLF